MSLAGMAEVSPQSDDREAPGNERVEELLEDLRIKIFEQGRSGLIAGDPRAQLFYERIAERLQEPDETDPLETRRCSLPGCTPASQRQWNEYVRQSVASVQRRASLLDEHGRSRVTYEYHSSGLLRHVDLADWRGRHRARIVYSAAGQPVEISLTAASGEVVAYTEDTFTAAGRCNFVAMVSELIELARRSFALFSQGLSPKQERVAQRNVEAVCDEVFPRVERLLRRELEEGRQLLPTSEDLLEMSFEQLLDLLAAEGPPEG
mmetsp:Transcript_4563/g.9307  ORF Transcript_4563/g.9307 Transcript_4563/m.9307 type:complete len:263 (+) Transcript_4563:113-901(+)